MTGLWRTLSCRPESVYFPLLHNVHYQWLHVRLPKRTDIKSHRQTLLHPVFPVFLLTLLSPVDNVPLV